MIVTLIEGSDGAGGVLCREKPRSRGSPQNRPAAPAAREAKKWRRCIVDFVRSFIAALPVTG